MFSKIELMGGVSILDYIDILPVNFGTITFDIIQRSRVYKLHF
jgi:hypothetical protein